METSASSKKRRGLPDEILNEEEIQALLGACSHQSPTGIRNRALITVLYRGGLRLGEALALTHRDINPRLGTLRVFNPKSGRTRFVRFDPMAFAVLGRWLDRRLHLQLGSRAPVFCTLSGEAIKQAYVRALLPRLGRRAGIGKRCHAHGLRHTYAAELARRQLPVEVIQSKLGHASKATTVRYVSNAQAESPPLPGPRRLPAVSLSDSGR